MTRRAATRMNAPGLALAALCCSGQTLLAAAPDAILVRSGSHPDFGRIVIDTANPARYEMERSGDHVVVRFTDPISLGVAPPPPRNVISVKTGGATIEFVAAAGATIHPKAISGHVVFDVLDPPVAAVKQPGGDSGQAVARVPKPDRPKPATPSIVSDSQSAMRRSPELGGRGVAPPGAVTTAGGAADAMASASADPPPGTAPRQAVAAEALPAPSPAALSSAAASPQVIALAAPASPAPPMTTVPAADPSLQPMQPERPGRDVLPEDAGPVGLMVHSVRLPQGLDGSAFIVPFASTTGAAAFQTGAGTLVVFDERRPIDLSPLRDDPVFVHADVQLLPSGTLLRLSVPQGVSVGLSPMPRGWRIAGLRSEPKTQPIVVTNGNGGITLAADQPGDVVSMADPDTGATLLVGTTHRPGQAVATIRRGAEFILRPTILGVAVEPLADSVTLKVGPTGFSLAGPDSGLAVSPQTPQTEAMMDAVHLTRRIDFPAMHTDALLRRLVRQIDDAAMTPAQARGPRRSAAALSMVSLGMDAEAESLLHLAAEDDPKQAASPDASALAAVAALLAGRTSEADGLDDPRLTGTDDIALWRAVRMAALDEGSPAAAAIFASTAPLAMLYPKPIGDRILPLIAETMVRGGELGPASRLLAKRKTDPRLDDARALLAEAEGDTDHALAMLDALADGHDQFDRARAAVHAVDLRLSSRKMTPNQAADALDKLVYAWRGDQRELAVRERIADLRGQAGSWRVALSTLRQAEADFPDQAKAIRARLRDAFANMIAGRGLEQMPPIDVVAAIDENADLIPAGSGDAALEEQLADRLLALDLPDRARPLLEKLMKASAPGAGKARFGATLAALDMREKNDAAALAALDASDAPDLPAGLTEKRALLRADGVARSGNPAAAAAALTAFGSPAAIEARASILEQAQDWAGAEQAWSDLASKALPDAGALDDAQARTLLRLTTAAARAGDDATLAGLRGKYDSHLAAGPLADMFRLLTAQPVRGIGDLKRAGQEVSLAQSLPANLKALDGPAPAR